ncbi:hypothetical protein MMC13_004496 [Lambiella insularis]|nr:hypothetical protein [Lambiella insularis]
MSVRSIYLHAQRLLEDIASNGKALLEEDQTARTRLLSAARALVAELETPRETIIRMCWAETNLFTSAMIARDVKLFAKLDEYNGGAKTVNRLAQMTGTEPALLSRLLKHMAAMNTIREEGPDLYSSTKLSKALTDPKMIDGIANYWHNILPSASKLPEYMAKSGHKNPQNAMAGPFQYANDTKLHCFAWISSQPEYLAEYNNHMAGYSQGRPSWMDPDFDPVDERLVQGARDDEDAVLLVDVGGGIGQDLKEFRRKHPKAPGDWSCKIERKF